MCTHSLRIVCNVRAGKAEHTVLHSKVEREIVKVRVEGASEIIFKDEIAAAEDPELELSKKEAEYAEKFANPFRAAQRGFIDEVILPKETRRKLLKAFAMLENKVVLRPKRKHGNIPL